MKLSKNCIFEYYIHKQLKNKQYKTKSSFQSLVLNSKNPFYFSKNKLNHLNEKVIL